mgnify:FL=1|tara:strand:+ start:673 stop:858 length:186 start_codon:yes stop_codon:yes gene_type:complete
MSKSYEKGGAENVLIEKEETSKTYILEDLINKKAGLEAQVAELDALIAEANKAGVKELPKE